MSLATELDAAHELEQEEFDRERAERVRALENEDWDGATAEIRVQGPAQLEMFKLGGTMPSSASLRFAGMKVKLVDGKAFKKGETIRFEGTAVINEVAQKDAHDSETQEVVSAEQRHSARITDLRVISLDG